MPDQFVRDPVTKTVINTDISYYNTIVAIREARKTAAIAKKENTELREQLTAVESELNEIRNLLQQVIRNNNG